MPTLPLHLHVVNFLGCSNSKMSRVRLTITRCLLRGAGGVVVWSKCGDINATILLRDACCCDWSVRTFFGGSAHAVSHLPLNTAQRNRALGNNLTKTERVL